MTSTEFKLPDDFAKDFAVIRERAELAQLEMRRGQLNGPAMRRHLTAGGGHPEWTLELLAMLEQLVAAAPANQKANATMLELSEKTLRYVRVVNDFINERPGYLLAMEEAPTADRDHCAGQANARRQLATALKCTVPELPGETTAPIQIQENS